MPTDNRSMEERLGSFTLFPLYLSGKEVKCGFFNPQDKFIAAEYINRVWQQGPVVRASDFIGSSINLPVEAQANASPGYLLYAISTVSIPKLIEFGKCGVVAHDASPDAWKTVAKTMEKINKECPFAVTFCDPAGLHGRFYQKPTKAFATKLQKIIEDLAPESGDVAFSELLALRVDPEYTDYKQVSAKIERLRKKTTAIDEVNAIRDLAHEFGRFCMYWDPVQHIRSARDE